MDEYIQKYLDGDLTEEEAAIFARALADNTELNAELRVYEQMLVAAAENRDVDPSAGFTDQVMERIEAPNHATHPSRGRARRWFGNPPAWGLRAAMAAGFVAVFMVGYLAPRPGGGTVDVGERTELPVAAVETGSAAMPVAHRLARLVYVPANPDVAEVSVAGTFNGWNPELTTMTRRGDVWVVQVLLPPQTYEYMFVEDGERWVTDPLAPQTRDDGFGRRNAVLDLEI
jgi:hypothetical protein